jgi:hypothetical protein
MERRWNGDGTEILGKILAISAFEMGTVLAEALPVA